MREDGIFRESVELHYTDEFGARFATVYHKNDGAFDLKSFERMRPSRLHKRPTLFGVLGIPYAGATSSALGLFGH